LTPVSPSIGRYSMRGREALIRPRRRPDVRMRIAYVSPQYFADVSYVGGGERYVLNLARAVALAADDIHVDVISYGPAAAATQVAQGVTLKLLRAANAPPEALDTTSWEIPEAIRDVDVVHLHQAFTQSSEFGLAAAKLLRKPVCMSDQGGQSSRLGQSLGSLELADRIICYSDFGASLFRTRTKVDLVRGGVDEQFFSPSETPVQRDAFLYVGRLLPHKGVDRLLAALPEGVPLRIVGRPYDQSYYALLQRLSRAREVSFITDADDAELLDAYRRAWAVVLPSTYVDCYGRSYLAPELMGLTLLEAMACGTPAICSAVGALPEFVRHGETGFVVESLHDLQAALDQLADDPALVERLGARAREVVVAEYGFAAAGPRMLGVYRELLAERAAAAA
jgi:glycosyltransferase involved in cell wall biosynthesis